MVGVEKQGPTVGAEIQRSAIISALLATLGILVYVALRYEFSFAMAAVAATAHDVLVTFALYALSGRQLSAPTVAAFLTIIGYSINDKIVVLDRVRENLRKYKRMPMKELIDLSVNETLSRTIITGVTGLMALGVMAYYGGEALFAFAVSMFFGIVIGTYSSIYVAAPMLTLLGVGRRDSFQSAEEKKKKKPRDEAYSAP